MRRLRRILWIVIVVLLALPALAVLALRWVEPPTTAYMLRTQWQTSDASADIQYRWRDMEDISPHLGLAAVAAEDQTFPDHHGFVWKAIGNAIEANLSHEGVVRGASSITQQVAKNLFLWPSQTYVRKAIEAYVTVWLELLLSKRRILALYLNIAQFGPTTFGAEAAAQRFFGVSANQLSRAQAALLAAVLPAPTEYSVRQPSDYVRQRQQWILRQMSHLGGGYLREIYP
ncbi:MAG: monofunctional biosynthetic peptidoglycan transglycosylase [Salinisphaera sp.]|nr:monofunctional biosynthetic peptidoglycan transglycosylase [Salinisphaera sp.]